MEFDMKISIEKNQVVVGNLRKAIFMKSINNIQVYLREFQEIMEFFLKDISLLAALKFEVKQKLRYRYVYMYHQATSTSRYESFALLLNLKSH